MPETPEFSGGGSASRDSTGIVVGCFLLLLVALHLVSSPLVELSKWTAAADSNSAVAEAVAWHDGRLTLPTRLHDTALFEGRIYNVFPPLFTLLSYAALGLGKPLGTAAGQFYAPWYVILVALPLPLAGYWAFRKAGVRSAWAACFTFFWIVGTPILPCLVSARNGGISQINHLLSQTGIMLIAGSMIAGRRQWPAWVGLVIAAWSRPLAIFYALGMAMSYRRHPSASGRGRYIGLALAVAVALALPMGLSWAKFGTPLDSGYKYLYEGRVDELARAGQRALFATEFLPRNAWYMNCETPSWQLGGFGLRPDVSPHGASIWMTMPLLVFILIDARRWWAVPTQRAIVLSTLPIIAGLLMFHGTGYIQPGYYRFALDFIPAWLVVIAARCDEGARRKGVTIAAMAWSALYFNIVTGMYAA